MARLGIDFGTTNTVVALNDRGSFPIVPHVSSSPIGQVCQEVFPSASFWEAATERLYHGPEAERMQAGGRSGRGVRSLKRLLPDYVEGMRVATDDSGRGLPVREVLTSFLAAVRESIRASGLVDRQEPLEAVITWPAHANGAQRIVTREAFVEAGFRVIGSLNEPTAAAIEYADRVSGGDGRRARRLKAHIAVFDFGGGTFDVSLVTIDGPQFHVVDTAGIDRLGGDDLDELLLALFLEELGIAAETLGPVRTQALRRYARYLKESLATGAAPSLVLNPADWGLAGRPVFVPVGRYLEAAEPLVRQAVGRLQEVVTGAAAEAAGLSAETLDAIYLVGGSSRFPLVGEMVRARFPTVRVITSDKPFTSVAVGAAIQAGRGVEVRDIFSRHFGVIRLADSGRRDFFDTIFRAGTRLPEPGTPPLEVHVRYSPRHNIGLMQYVECTALGPEQMPAAGARHWAPVRLPYDPAMRLDAPLEQYPIEATDALSHTEVEERYRCDSDGVISMEFVRRADGGRRRFEIFCE